jgi:AAA domain
MASPTTGQTALTRPIGKKLSGLAVTSPAPTPAAATARKAPVDYQTLYLRAFIFGRSGTGKSHLLTTAADCPECLPALIMSGDGGAQTLYRRAHEQITVVPILAPADLNKCLEMAMSGQFKFVAFDGLKTTCDMLLDFVNPPVDNKTLIPLSASAWDTASIRDRGIVLNMVLRLVSWLCRRVPAHVVMTSLAEDVYDDEGKSTGEMTLAVPGKLKRLAPGEFALTGFMDLRKRSVRKDGAVQQTVQQVLQISPSSKVPEAKTRYADSGSELTADIVDPTMSKLLKHMKGVLVK